MGEHLERPHVGATATAALAAALLMAGWLGLYGPGWRLAVPPPLAAVEASAAERGAQARPRSVPALPPRRPAVGDGAVSLAAAGGYAVPAPPARMRTATPVRTTVRLPDDAERLRRYFETMGYELSRVREGDAPVPRVFAAALPSNLRRMRPVEARKRLFLRLVLPLVLKANEEVAERRQRLSRLHARLARGRPLNAADRRWLERTAELYGVDDGDVGALLRRVDVVPVSMAIAQAIQESGWGTSRFARRGNALYGQRTWSDRRPGLRPRQADDPDFRVRAYGELADGVHAYMHNLNTHPAYADFRERRARRRAVGRGLDGYALAATLAGYSEERTAYVEKLRELMRHNALPALDGARLASGPLVRRVVPDAAVDSVQLAYRSGT